MGSTSSSHPSRCPVFIRLPWIGRKASHFEKLIRAAVDNTYYATKVQFVYTTSRAFRLPKDVLPTPHSSNIIYLFECRNCEARYVGKTSQHLITRIKQHVPRYLLMSGNAQEGQEHRKRGRPPRQKVNHQHSSAIAQHLVDNAKCRNTYSDSDFSVLTHARSNCHLNVLESVYIHHLNPELCKQKSFVWNLQLHFYSHKPIHRANS